MKKNNGKLKQRQKKKLRKIFFTVVIVTAIVSIALVAGIAGLYNKYMYNGGTSLGHKNEPLDKINKTLAVFGVDEDGYRTDVIFVVNYNSDTGKVKVVSVPRDTRVEWNKQQQEKLIEYAGYSRNVSKINEMTSYGGIEHIRDFTINEIEELLNVEIDNYIIITIDAFRKIVDAIGGVEVDVPALADGNGLHYDDNYADLHIHLEPGLQVLDGEQAEGLVRFRKGYAEGDVGRIKTQQLFLEAFAKKITSPAIITKIPNIINAILSTVTTDIRLNEMSGYLPYLKVLDMNNLSFNIIPGEAAYQDGAWYYIPDLVAMPEFIDEIFYDKVPEEVIEDKTVTIEVLNSTYTAGLAGKAKEELELAGYTVNEIGNYTAEELSQTVIYARDTSLANQFKAYFPGAAIEQDSTLTNDIRIILGYDNQ